MWLVHCFKWVYMLQLSNVALLRLLECYTIMFLLTRFVWIRTNCAWKNCNTKMSKHCNFEYFSFLCVIIFFYFFLGFLQKHFDFVCCRGGVREKIFEPWMESLKSQGCKFLKGKKVTDVLLDEKSGRVSEVVCEKESFKADAIILAVGVSTLQEIIQNRYFSSKTTAFKTCVELFCPDLPQLPLFLFFFLDQYYQYSSSKHKFNLNYRATTQSARTNKMLD